MRTVNHNNMTTTDDDVRRGRRTVLNNRQFRLQDSIYSLDFFKLLVCAKVLSHQVYVCTRGQTVTYCPS